MAVTNGTDDGMEHNSSSKSMLKLENVGRIMVKNLVRLEAYYNITLDRQTRYPHSYREKIPNSMAGIWGFPE